MEEVIKIIKYRETPSHDKVIPENHQEIRGKKEIVVGNLEIYNKS